MRHNPIAIPFQNNVPTFGGWDTGGGAHHPFIARIVEQLRTLGPSLVNGRAAGPQRACYVMVCSASVDRSLLQQELRCDLGT